MDFLIFRTGELVCALAVRHVVEVMRPLPLEPVVKMPPSLLGESVIRGESVPIIDTAALSGAHARSRQRIVAIKAGHRRAGLAVDAVVEVRALSPELLHDARRLDGAAVAGIDPAIVAVLREIHVMPDAIVRETIEAKTA